MYLKTPRWRMLGTAFVVAFTSCRVFSGGFSLYTEGSTVAVGNFAAGVAAEAADASIGWYNPAGLVLISQQQLLASGVGVLPSSRLTGVSTFATDGQEPYIQRFTNLQGGKNALVPALHYALPLGERAAFGFSLISPFGLSTDYATTSPVRYEATLTELMTVNASPELAGRLTRHLSVGAGLDLQWAQVKFNQVLGIPTILQSGGLNPTSFDSTSNNRGRSFGVGFHAGVLAVFDDNHTRIGLNYQSRMNHTFHGTSTLTGILADPDLSRTAVFRSDSLYSNGMALPEVVTLSAYRDVSARTAWLASVVYTGWSVFDTTQLNHVAAFSPDFDGLVLLDVFNPQNYKNTWRFALGMNHRLTDQWLLRMGAGYDQTPTVNSARDVRLPDADRWALSVGAHYQMRPNLGWDVGYTYLFAADKAQVNKTNPLGTGAYYQVTALANVHAQLIGLQVVWMIDKEWAAS